MKRKQAWMLVSTVSSQVWLLTTAQKRGIFERWNSPHGIRMARALVFTRLSRDQSKAHNGFMRWAHPAKQIHLRTGDEVSNPQWTFELELFFRANQWPEIELAKKSFRPPPKSVVIEKQLKVKFKQLKSWLRKEKLAQTYIKKLKRQIKAKQKQLCHEQNQQG